MWYFLILFMGIFFVEFLVFVISCLTFSFLPNHVAVVNSLLCAYGMPAPGGAATHRCWLVLADKVLNLVI